MKQYIFTFMSRPATTFEASSHSFGDNGVNLFNKDNKLIAYVLFDGLEYFEIGE